MPQPWQRGKNENTNGLLRQYLHKNGDIRIHNHAALNQFAERLNGRQRAIFGGRTPSEMYAEMSGAGRLTHIALRGRCQTEIGLIPIMPGSVLSRGILILPWLTGFRKAPRLNLNWCYRRL